MDTLSIKNASLEEIDFFISKAKEEGWNPGLNDALPFYHADPAGYFLGKVDREVIGCISAVAYGNALGFMGFYIVVPSMRKKGYGHQLFAHALNYLGARPAGLDGVINQQKSYEAMGFKPYFRNQRFEGKGGGSAPEGLFPLTDIPLESILEYDAPIFGVERKDFLEVWLRMPNAVGMASLEKGRLSGYGLMRKCYNGYKVGPLFADSSAIADSLYLGLCSLAKEGPVFLDVAGINKEGAKLAERHRLKPVFETIRMYNKIPPEPQFGKVFGITSFELG